MHHKQAQFVGHKRLLNLYFGSSQMDNWSSRYGHFKFWGGVVLQNNFTLGSHAVEANVCILGANQNAWLTWRKVPFESI
jgi:hypothetical protein